MGNSPLKHTYRDEGISGATNQRPGLISLMAAVDSGEVDVVVVEDLSRLSRDIEHSASMRKRFAFSGVRLIGIADGIDTLGNGGDLLYGVKSILSEQYLKDLGDKTSRGLRERAQIGRVTGALPYGYTSATAPDGQGKVPVIVAAKAAVVRRIFRMRAAGRSYRDIAKTLNDEGVEPPRGRQKDSRKRRDGWAMSGVRSMLQNSKYAGRWTFGARSWKKSPTTGKRVVRPAESPVVEVALPELRIVDEETWSRVQAINEEARERHATVGPSAYAREGGAQYRPAGLPSVDPHSLRRLRRPDGHREDAEASLPMRCEPRQRRQLRQLAHRDGRRLFEKRSRLRCSDTSIGPRWCRI